MKIIFCYLSVINWHLYANVDIWQWALQLGNMLSIGGLCFKLVVFVSSGLSLFIRLCVNPNLSILFQSGAFGSIYFDAKVIWGNCVLYTSIFVYFCYFCNIVQSLFSILPMIMKFIYIYIYMCVCVCALMSEKSNIARSKLIKLLMICQFDVNWPSG